MLESARLALTPKEELEGPIQLVLFVTDRCNARCSHCFNWRALNQGADLLSPEELATLSKELGTLLTVSLSGGEPFLRPDLARVVGLFPGAGNVFIPTNGLNPERVEREVRSMLETQRAAPLVVSLSLDGPPALHDRIRGVPGNYTRLLETYRALAALKREAGDRLRLKAGTVLCNLNVHALPELIGRVKNEMPDVDFHDFEILRGEPPDGSLAAPTVADLERVKPHVFAVWERSAFFGKSHPLRSWLALGIKRFLFTLHIETLRQKRQLIPCYAGRTSAVIDEKGNLSFCELREKIGNVRETPFAELWRSRKAESVRASIERGDCHCVHSCFQQKNVFLNPSVWPHVVRYLATGEFTVPPRDDLASQGAEAATRKPT